MTTENETNLYSILGVNKDATQQEIKDAYRSAAKILHPDLATGNAESFKALNEAYRILSDPDARARYDLTGETTKKETLNFEAMALQALPDCFRMTLSQHKGEHVKKTNIVRKMKEVIEDTTNHLKEQKKEAVVRYKELLEIMDRFSFKKTKRSSLHETLTRTIIETKEAVKRMAIMIKVNKTMLECLKGYKYRIAKKDRAKLERQAQLRDCSDLFTALVRTNRTNFTAG